MASWHIKTRSSHQGRVNGADQNGGFVDTRTPSGEMPPNRTRKRRITRRSTEVGFDLAAWIIGLLVTGAAIGDVTGNSVTVWVVARVLPAACVLAVGCGLAAGLYRGRHQRGSFDEVVAVSAATFGTGAVLVLLTALLLPGQREPLRTVAGGTVLAMLAMLGGRHVLSAVRQRARAAAPAPAAVKVIVFGAGAAGGRLVQNMHRAARFRLPAGGVPGRRPGQAAAPGARRRRCSVTGPGCGRSRPRPAPRSWSSPSRGPAARRSRS